MINKVNQRIDECFTLLESKYKQNFTRPEVTFDLKGRAAGQAISNLFKHKIRLNKILLSENFDTFMATTIPHEVCHIVAFQLNSKCKPHGNLWKILYGYFVNDVKRCHEYDISNVSTKKQERFKYSCGCSIHNISKTLHNRMLNGQVRVCNACKNVIKFIG